MTDVSDLIDTEYYGKPFAAILEALEHAYGPNANMHDYAVSAFHRVVKPLMDERDEALASYEREADWNKFVERMNVDGFDDAAEKWLEMPSIQRMHNAAASIFSKWADDELMGRFKQHMTNIMHQSFVEGAIVGHRVATNGENQTRAKTP